MPDTSDERGREAPMVTTPRDLVRLSRRLGDALVSRARRRAADDRRLEVETAHEENVTGEDYAGRKVDAFVEGTYPEKPELRDR